MNIFALVGSKKSKKSLAKKLSKNFSFAKKTKHDLTRPNEMAFMTNLSLQQQREIESLKTEMEFFKIQYQRANRQIYQQNAPSTKSLRRKSSTKVDHQTSKSDHSFSIIL